MTKTNIISWIRQLRSYVIADPNDNSITFSHGLYKRLKLLKYENEPKAYVFRVPGGKYAFAINPEGLPDTAPLATIQFNTKYKTIGFESLVPTVQRIFFDYGLPSDKSCKLSVTSKKLTTEQKKQLRYYVIEKPYV